MREPYTRSLPLSRLDFGFAPGSGRGWIMARMTAVGPPSTTLDTPLAGCAAVAWDLQGWGGRELRSRRHLNTQIGTSQSNALHALRRTSEAQAQLLAVVGQFFSNATMRYNLACYACQLGDLKAARDSLAQAFSIEDSDA